MPQYKLTYFPIRGLAEQTRLLFIDNKIEFEDDLVDREKWSAMKSNFVCHFALFVCWKRLLQVFGQVPCLTDGNLQVCQSGAIMRHLARKHSKLSHCKFVSSGRF